MAVHLTDHRGGFGPGRTPITRLEEAEDATGIALSVHRLAAGERLAETAQRETAFLLMDGAIDVQIGTASATLARRSLFDERPSAVHLSAGERFEIVAKDGPAELTVYETANPRRFRAAIHRAADVADEHRGKGLLRDASFRFVRTIFDASNTDSASELVLGEVVTMPGRWSSYPPHHHPQPEIYHYRFTDPRGYGHAELGDAVLKVRHNDTVKILAAIDHPQCAAPGYGMYYSWVIRHLPEARYGVPEFTAEHRWTLSPDAKFWWPKGVDE